MQLVFRDHVNILWLVSWGAYLILSCGLVWSQSQSKPYDLVSRNYYLDDLIKPHEYSPVKNSFLFQNLYRGDRKDILDIHGSGSVRHIWSTWSIPGNDSDVPAPGRIFVRIFIDGAPEPAVSGALDELCRAAEATGTQSVPFPAFNYKGAFNFYLPIFFNRGIRIEIEAMEEIEEFYTQIDYRTGQRLAHSPRLVSESNKDGIALKYLNGGLPQSREIPRPNTIERTRILAYGGANSAELTIGEPGILRTLSFRGETLADLELEIYWDDHQSPDIQAPLQYFFADFVNAAMDSKPGQVTCYFPMPFRKAARLLVRSLSRQTGNVTVDYALESRAVSDQTPYFHAQYHQTEKTPGYAQYSALRIMGEGLFVGINLFDSGHNHGGGDAALIDAGTTHPKVLHGICGEDYFGFAWHHTGTMTPLTGAPVHERRYRLHLENPYPFHESIQFLFGVFAGQHPKSVAFWYQLPQQTTKSQWQTFDLPWKVLGPLGLATPAPDVSADDNDTYSTVVPINHPTNLEERWQNAEMQSGFFDATYQFRHDALTESGTGFVAGTSKTRMVTYIYSLSPRKVKAVFGHDDRVTMRINGRTIADIPSRMGFGPYFLTLALSPGWNKFDLIIYNDENSDWRWNGISLALDRSQSRGVKFASHFE
jgi:hypothetical protein